MKNNIQIKIKDFENAYNNGDFNKVGEILQEDSRFFLATIVDMKHSTILFNDFTEILILIVNLINEC